MNTISTELFIKARAEMGRRQAVRRALRYGREIRGPESDAYEMMLEVDAPPSPPMAIHMVYQDSKAQLSHRTITLRRLTSEIDEVRVWAYCHMRNAMRSFLGSRAVEVTDLATGEVHEDGLGFFRSHPVVKHMTADDLAVMSPGLLAIQECRDEIILLSFLAASDGDFDEAETDAIVLHVMNAVPDPDVLEADVRARVRAFTPDEIAFDRALGRMCAGAGNAARLVRSMRKVIDADGEIDAEEVAFASEIEGRLRSAGRL